MNKVILVGRIVANIEVSTTKSNINYARFNIAVNRKNSNNDITDFLPVVAWRNTATFLANNTMKGSQILVEGTLMNNRFVNSQGQNVSSFEISAENIELLETKSQFEARKNGLSNSSKNFNSFNNENNFASNNFETHNDVTFAPNNNSSSNEENNEEEDWDLDSFI